LNQLWLIALEVKSASTTDDFKATHLNWFEREFTEYSITKCVVTTGSYAFTRDDGIHVIPASFLQA
jgi:hypothetical protein